MAKIDLNKIIIIHVNPTKLDTYYCQETCLNHKDRQKAYTRMKKETPDNYELEQTCCSYINSRRNRL